jgi:hypothetical protein
LEGTYKIMEAFVISLLTIFQRVTSIADRLNIDFALIHKERKKANEVREYDKVEHESCMPFFTLVLTGGTSLRRFPGPDPTIGSVLVPYQSKQGFLFSIQLFILLYRCKASNSAFLMCI